MTHVSAWRSRPSATRSRSTIAVAFYAADDAFHAALAGATGLPRVRTLVIREKTALDRLRALRWMTWTTCAMLEDEHKRHPQLRCARPRLDRARRDAARGTCPAFSTSWRSSRRPTARISNDVTLPSRGDRGVAGDLYAAIRDLPIVSPHGHCDPAWWAEDAAFPDPAALADHARSLPAPDALFARGADGGSRRGPARPPATAARSSASSRGIGMRFSARRRGYGWSTRYTT
jgi:hypothetical protein